MRGVKTDGLTTQIIAEEVAKFKRLRATKKSEEPPMHADKR